MTVLEFLAAGVLSVCIYWCPVQAEPFLVYIYPRGLCSRDYILIENLDVSFCLKVFCVELSSFIFMLCVLILISPQLVLFGDLLAP